MGRGDEGIAPYRNAGRPQRVGATLVVARPAARLTTSGGLYDKALRAVGGAQARTAAPAARPEAAPRKQEGAARIRLEGRVLSGRHVQGCPPHSTLWVPRETLITQLAADEARRRDICIRKET